MYPHRIRLRGPWEAEPLDPPAAARRVTMPARLAECGLGECRRVTFRRRFGRPRQIDAHERVWLIGEGLTGRAEFRVNEQLLGTHGGDLSAFAFPITHILAERNELRIDLAADGPSGGLWGDIAIEVRCQAYLENVAAAVLDNGRLRITGEVRGEAERALEVYVLADGRTIGYGMCVAAATFAIVSDEVVPVPVSVRAELVNGAVVWFVMEFPVC